MKQLIGTMVILNLIIVMFVTGVISVGAQGGEPDAGVPTSMNYQGYLTDDTGEPVAGPVDITFTIYTTGGVPVWAEKHFGIEPSNGLFSVELGDHGSPMAAAVFDGNMELGIKVNNDTEMNPRQKIASMGYALRCEEANNANTLDGMDSFDFVAAGGDTMSGALNISSNLDVTGNTSLGNASTDSLTVAARVNSDLIPLIDNSYDLGYFTRYWQDLYVDDAYTNRLFTEGYAYISGTLNLADDDGDNDTILFDHKSDYKHLQWNEANDRFEFNSDLNVSGTVSATSFVGDGTGLTGVDSLWNESSSDIYYNSGNVGIGITIPNSLLHVEGNSSNPTIKGVNSGNGQGLYGITYGSGAAVQGMSNGAGAGGYFTSASGYGLIVANGNVGIGTTSPTSLLEVDGVITAAHGDSDNWNAAYGWGDHDTAGYLQSETDPVFGSSAASGISGTDISEWDTAYGWGNHATAGYDDTNDSWTGTGSTSTTSGNVGIGINSPETMLHIYHGAGGGSNPDTTYDPLAIESANNAYVNLITPSSNLGGLVFSDNVRARGLIGYDHTDDHMQFRTNGSIRMKINSSGDIGIGTTSPGNRLDINTTNTDKGIAFNGEDALTGYNGNEWLYLNPNQDYTGGVYTPANFVAYGNLGVGDSSPVAQFVVGSDAGVDYVAGAGDAYVQNDLEVDGTIYGDLTGSVDLNYTPGSILFTGSGGVISQNNSALYWDNTNNRLGINNSSPVDDLHVKGTGVLQGVFESTTTDGGISIVSSTGQDYGLHSLDDGGFAIYDRTDIRYPLKINTDGEVGIGIASPESQLHVAGGNWDLSSTEGDLKVGDSNYRMKVGVATDGGGAGTVRIRADGGTDRLILGSGDEDKMFVHEDGVKFGANGVSIAEIVELTGYTDSEDPGTSWLTTGVYYLNPAWSGTNTYVLSCDVSYGGCSEIWEGMGAGHPDNYSNWYMTISADGGVCISITTHNSSFYRNVPYRIVIMRKG